MNNDGMRFHEYLPVPPPQRNLLISPLKVTKEWKFSVVEAVMGCKDRGVLGQDILESFRNILKQGPFWVPAKTRTVATLE